ncbi:MAG TPA: dihydropteroate synthase [Ferrovibrio sp.]|uniref:dihydropteroate synthase n=1 Tax=Ferrovibrio sp. TaxID=1917215 RepID=UPI002B4B6849|nr:dihydropteroate synthase [Ferrovibrio sp.]HLT78378.1 dihydropteroate synthase [Ferrovibrio sp.]
MTVLCSDDSRAGAARNAGGPAPLAWRGGAGDRAAHGRLDWSRPYVMGIVNVTADSFSGDGLNTDAQAAIARARQMVADGADLIDLGAESTRPGAQPVSADEEIARLLPVLEGLRDLAIPVSVDTRHAATMRAALQAGAAIINDISALEDDPGSLAAVAGAQCPVVLMHKQGDPQTMQVAPRYDDVVAEVHDYLAGRIKACEAAGIARQRIILDPGIGFGKTLEHNLALLRDGLAALRNLGCALLVGVSRKSMIGALTGERDPARRVAGSLAAGLRAVQQGAHILRVHDVPETVQALRVWRGIAGDTSP